MNFSMKWILAVIAAVAFSVCMFTTIGYAHAADEDGISMTAAQWSVVMSEFMIGLIAFGFYVVVDCLDKAERRARREEKRREKEIEANEARASMEQEFWKSAR